MYLQSFDWVLKPPQAFPKIWNRVGPEIVNKLLSCTAEGLFIYLKPETHNAGELLQLLKGETKVTLIRVSPGGKK